MSRPFERPRCDVWSRSTPQIVACFSCCLMKIHACYFVHNNSNCIHWINERTQVHSARSSLVVTHPSTNRGRRACLNFSERVTELALVPTVNLSSVPEYNSCNCERKTGEFRVIYSPDISFTITIIVFGIDVRCRTITLDVVDRLLTVNVFVFTYRQKCNAEASHFTQMKLNWCQRTSNYNELNYTNEYLSTLPTMTLTLRRVSLA